MINASGVQKEKEMELSVTMDNSAEIAAAVNALQVEAANLRDQAAVRS